MNSASMAGRAHLNLCPVNVSGEPISGHVQRSFDVVGGHRDDGLTISNLSLVAARKERPFYPFLFFIRDVQHHGARVVIHSGDFGGVFENGEFPAILFARFNDLSVNVGADGKDHFGVSTRDGSADSTELITEPESIPTRTGVGAIVIGTNLRTVISKRLAFVDINTFFGIAGIDHKSSIA